MITNIAKLNNFDYALKFTWVGNRHWNAPNYYLLDYLNLSTYYRNCNRSPNDWRYYCRPKSGKASY